MKHYVSMEATSTVTAAVLDQGVTGVKLDDAFYGAQVTIMGSKRALLRLATDIIEAACHADALARAKMLRDLDHGVLPPHVTIRDLMGPVDPATPTGDHT